MKIQALLGNQRDDSRYESTIPEGNSLKNGRNPFGDLRQIIGPIDHELKDKSQ